MKLFPLLLAATSSTASAFTSPRAIRPVSPVSPVSPTSTASSSSQLQALDVATAANAFDTFCQTQPYAAAFMTCSIKASAADLVVQSQEEDDDEPEEPLGGKMAELLQTTETTATDIDFQRNMAFWLYGGIYQGCTQEFLYNTIFPRFFGDSHDIRIVLEQVLIDMTVLTPFLCLPVAYVVKAAIARDENLMDGLCKYVKHVQDEGLLFKYWSLWFPVQCLTFGVIPHHYRIPFIAVVSFFWLMILSSLSSKEDEQAITTSATSQD